MQTKKNAHDRLAAARTIRDSQVCDEDVELLFKPEFLNVPGKSDQVGRRIIGSTVDEVMEEILHQLTPVGFPVESVEEFNKIYLEKFPKLRQTELLSTVEFLRVIFKDVHIDGRETSELILALEKAKENMRMYAMDVDYTTTQLDSTWFPLEVLVNELVGSHKDNVTSSHKSSLHMALTKYWLHLFDHVVKNMEKIDQEIFRYVYFRENGACNFRFDMDISEDFLLLNCKNAVNANVQSSKVYPKGDASTSGDVPNITMSTKTIVAQPDLIGYCKRNNSGDEASKLFFVAEFKGPLHTMSQERAKSNASASEQNLSDATLSTYNNDIGDSDETSELSSNKRKCFRQLGEHHKRRKYSTTCENKDEPARTYAMHSQHFLQLLCAIKFQNIRRMATVIDKCFGMYCVEHRFYITGLAAVGKNVKEDILDISTARKLYMSGCGTPEAFRDDPDIKLRMACTDYLDMTSPVHIEAMLKFVAVLSRFVF